MTPEQEAAYALDWNLSRDGLSLAVQAEYDRLKRERDAGRYPPPVPPPVPTVTFRRPMARWPMVLLASVLPGLVFLSGVLVNSTHGWEKIANGVAVLAFVVLGVRIARLGIFAGPEQLVVRDYFRTYRIRWREIASIEMPPRYGTLRKTGLRIHLIDGRLISATLYSQGQIDSGRATRKVVEELDRLRQQFTGDRTADAQSATTVPRR